MPRRFRAFFFQTEDGIRDPLVTGVQTCALPIWQRADHRASQGDHQPRRQEVLPARSGGDPLYASEDRARRDGRAARCAPWRAKLPVRRAEGRREARACRSARVTEGPGRRLQAPRDTGAFHRVAAHRHRQVEAPHPARLGARAPSRQGIVGRMAAALSGKLVLVTGASAGIGRASALALARAGAKVIATGRRAAELDALRKEIAAQTLAGDLNDARFAEELAGASREVDIFVNNAGILKYAPLLDMSDEDCEAMFRTNVLAAFRIMRVVAKAMVERRGGHIIVMSSIAAREVYQLGGIYCATKHALSA